MATVLIPVLMLLLLLILWGTYVLVGSAVGFLLSRIFNVSQRPEPRTQKIPRPGDLLTTRERNDSAAGMWAFLAVGVGLLIQAADHFFMFTRFESQRGEIKTWEYIEKLYGEVGKYGVLAFELLLAILAIGGAYYYRRVLKADPSQDE
ncbi:hypothetical protein [Planctomicrobium piriforme]|nr:hypothetical protein [Planctomicrobium piriforme]